MKPVFADTSYWIALLNPRDELRTRAVASGRSYSSDQIVTSEMVLVEFLNGFSDRGTHLRAAAAKAVQTLRSSPNVWKPITAGWPSQGCTGAGAVVPLGKRNARE